MVPIGLSAIKGKVRPPVRFKLKAQSSSTEALTKRLELVIQQAYTKPFSLQSDFARSHAFFVAAAASMGLITTRTAPKQGLFGHLWRATKQGLSFLEKEP